jgi:hypothetical protein
MRESCFKSRCFEGWCHGVEAKSTAKAKADLQISRWKGDKITARPVSEAALCWRAREAHMDLTKKLVAQSSDQFTNELHQFVQKELAKWAVKKIDVEYSQDHDGDSIINVTVRHKLSDKPVKPSIFFRDDGRVRDLAWSLGERRFVHVKHLFDRKQKIAA